MKNAKRHFAGGTYILALLVGLVATPSAQAQTFKVLYSFTGGQDGANPLGAVIRDAAGNLYGTTTSGGGGADCGTLGCGTVFKLDATGTETVLYGFTGGADGLTPLAGVVRDQAGNLYGTTNAGGFYGLGVVFKLDSTGRETELYSFMGGAGGDFPFDPVALFAHNLYGTTSSGGDSACNGGNGCGVVFKLDGVGKETVLYAFTDGADGGFPEAGVIRDAAGNLYGTTAEGGDSVCNNGTGCGVVFKLDPSGAETVLYTFMGGADGAAPVASVIRDAAGNLYGTTVEGGDLSGCSGFGCGVVFKLDTAGHETVLYTFTGGADGSQPFAGVILDAVGNLYGAAEFGGDSACNFGCGVLFKLDATGKETVLHTFTGGADGNYPAAGLIHDGAGNLYGTASQGGLFHEGTVFEIIRK